MAEGTKKTPPAINLTDAEVAYIVLSLCENDEFRSRIKEDPVSALKDLGITVDPKKIPAEITLPDKAECRNNLKIFVRTPAENRTAFVIRWPFICG